MKQFKMLLLSVVVMLTAATASMGNTPPTAGAGPDKTVQVNHPVTISGSGSDSDGGIVSYRWNKKSNGALLSKSQIFNFIPSGTNTKTLVLTVTDDEGAKDTDEMVLTVTNDATPPTTGNTPPTADAGRDKTVQVNHPVTISGSGRDSDGGIVSYQWKKKGTDYVISNEQIFVFSPGGTKTKTLVLTVTDDEGAKDTDEMVLTVTVDPVDSTPDSVPPTNTPLNTSGIIPNSVDLIWADMHDKPTAYGAYHPGYPEYYGPVFKGKLPTRLKYWEKINIWFEVAQMNHGITDTCGFSSDTSTNTVIEYGPMYAAWLDKSGKWHVYADGLLPEGGLRMPGKPSEMFFEDACSKQNNAITDLRKAHKDYKVKQGHSVEGNILYRPDFGYYYHGWPQATGAINKNTIKAVYGGCYVRLVKKDPKGDDDRKRAKFGIHISSDVKREDRTSCMGDNNTKCGWGIGGISRMKQIPQNGDWMPINFLEGWITKKELAANPPPFSIHP